LDGPSEATGEEDDVLALLTWLHAPTGRYSGVLVVALLIAGIAALVYATGGTLHPVPHLIYIPILVAGFAYGPVGGILAAVVGGIALGPAMPLDVAHAIPQSLGSWLGRMGFLMLIGAAMGAMASALYRHAELLRAMDRRSAQTGLPNRTALVEDVHALAEARGPREPFAVIMYDLVRFLALVSTYGNRIADEAVRQSAERLRAVSPEGHALYDLGGGYFAALIRAPDFNSLIGSARSVVEEIRGTVEVERMSLSLIGHAGIAYCPPDTDGGSDTIRRAFEALGHAKRLGLPHAVFDTKRDFGKRRAVQLLGDIRDALRSDEQLTLRYQPKVDLKSGTIVGGEALIRWTHPAEGAVSPGEFIPLVEDSELMPMLTRWVLTRAVEHLRDMRAARCAVPISVNVSVRDLEEPDFPAFIEELLSFYAVPPDHLELEVTETVFMARPELCRRVLETCRSRGVHAALDDFGAGATSLAYLRDLPVDTVKLDMSFVQSLPGTRKNQTIVRSLIPLVHELDMKVVAEGIETQAIADLLREWGCDHGQGYWTAPALPADEFVARLGATLH